MQIPSIEKLETGIEKFDEALDGGIPKNHQVLITGTAGTMKSSLAFQIAYANVLKNKTAMYLTLEQSADSILRQMELMKFDLGKIRKNSNDKKVNKEFSSGGKGKGMLTILDIGLFRTEGKSNNNVSNWISEIKKLVKQYSGSGMADIVILDSLTALFHLGKIKDEREELFQLFKWLKGLDTTSLIINEMQQGATSYSNYGVESYLVDGVIHLSSKERKFNMNRELNIVKMRYVDHATNVFVLKFTNGKFLIAPRKMQEE